MWPGLLSNRRACKLANSPPLTYLLAGLAISLLDGCSAIQQVAHVVTAEDLRVALLSENIAHVVLHGHLDLKRQDTEWLPLKVHGPMKTIRGACHEPSERLLGEDDEDDGVGVSPSWKYLQCIISVPHAWLDIESQAERSSVWISDVYIISEGFKDDEVVQADNSALITADNTNVWVTGVSFVGGTGMNRAVAVKDGSMFLGGCVFYRLELDTPSPVLLLDTGTAYFYEAVFSSIKGPPACGAVHVYRGAVAFEGSMWIGTHRDVEYDICLADISSRVYSDGIVEISSLELGADASTLDLDRAAEQDPGFLQASDDELIQLIQSQITETAMLWPTSVPEVSAGTESGTVENEHASYVVVVCAVAGGSVLLAALGLLMMILHRSRSKRMRGDEMDKASYSGGMEESTPTVTPMSVATKNFTLESISTHKPSDRSDGAIGMGIYTTGGLPSAHADSYGCGQLDSFMTQPPQSGGSAMSQDEYTRQCITCPIQMNLGPTGPSNSSQMNMSGGRALVRSVSSGSGSGPSGLRQTPWTMPRRKLARWNSLDACLAEELEIASDKLQGHGAMVCSRPMASLQEEGNTSDNSETLTLGAKNKGHVFPRCLESYAGRCEPKAPNGGNEGLQTMATNDEGDDAEGSDTALDESASAVEAGADALEAVGTRSDLVPYEASKCRPGAHDHSTLKTPNGRGLDSVPSSVRLGSMLYASKSSFIQSTATTEQQHPSGGTDHREIRAHPCCLN